MEIKAASERLAALGNESRLSIFRLLVEAGHDGVFAGAIGERLARHPGVGMWLDRVAGTIFVLLGLRLLVSR